MTEKIKVVMQPCCVGCGLPIDIQREPIILDNNILSLLFYEKNQCEICGSQKDGTTLPMVHKVIKNIVSKYKQREKQIINFYKEFSKLNNVNRSLVAVWHLEDVDNLNNKTPYSWNVVALEIENSTKLGLELLNEMEFKNNEEM